MHQHAASTITPIVWTGDALRLLDQRLLPAEETYNTYFDAPAVADAITTMVVRGAPAIGITAAYGVVLSALRHGPDLPAIEADIERLGAARPTAVNLFWALARMRLTLQSLATAEPSSWPSALAAEAIALHAEDRAACAAMGKLGAGYFAPHTSVYTHCNAGALATGGEGTSLAVVRQAQRQGLLHQAFVGETRPWMQGSRLTAWELRREGIPVCLSTESAAATLFRQGKVQWLVVGADRITRCGDVANKVGTYPLALLARHHGVKVMVVAPRSTIDIALLSGDEIPIEQRPAHEVTHFGPKALAPEGCSAFNPSFDVTPASHVDVLVTEVGAIATPTEDRIMDLMGRAQ